MKTNESKAADLYIDITGIKAKMGNPTTRPNEIGFLKKNLDRKKRELKRLIPQLQQSRMGKNIWEELQNMEF